MIEYLARCFLISSDGTNKLKTKKYTKLLFSSINYYAVADNREDNMGNFDCKRYGIRLIVFK